MSHFSWLFIEKTTGRCKLCEAAGVEKFVKSANSTNNSTHLQSVHSMTEEDDRVKEARAQRDKQPTIDNALVKSKTDQDFLDYMLVFATPIVRTENDLFRAVHSTAPCTRTALRGRLVSHSQRRNGEALNRLRSRTVTLAVDAGTIWKKYLVIAALAYGKQPPIVTCTHAEHMPATFIEETLNKTIAELLAAGVYAIAITADNASNMTAGIARCALLHQRCLAHSIQLCVNDAFSAEPLQTLWSAARTILKDNNLSEPPPTRWSGKYLALTRIVDPNSELNIGGVEPRDFLQLLPLCRALKPFYIATQSVQGNSATMLTAAAVVASLLAIDSRDTLGTRYLPYESPCRVSDLGCGPGNLLFSILV
jgi:hypothetical protein